MFEDPFIKMLAIIFVVLALVFCFILFGYSVIRYNRTGSKRFNFLTYFPFELNGYRRHSATSFIDVSLITVTYLLFIAPMIIFAIFSGQISSYIMLAIYVLAISLFFILFFTKLSTFKLHLILAISFVCLQILFLLLALTYFGADKHYVINSNVRTIITVIIIIQLIFEFILILNPNIKDWAIKVKFDAEVFSRPKYNYLAMLEWGTFLNFVLNYIVLILASFF